MHSKVLEVNILAARVRVTVAKGAQWVPSGVRTWGQRWEACPSSSVFATSEAVHSLNARVPGDLWLWLPFSPQINSCLEKRQLMSQGSLHVKNHWTRGKDHCQHRKKASPRDTWQHSQDWRACGVWNDWLWKRLVMPGFLWQRRWRIKELILLFCSSTDRCP